MWVYEGNECTGSNSDLETPELSYHNVEKTGTSIYFVGDFNAPTML